MNEDYNYGDIFQNTKKKSTNFKDLPIYTNNGYVEYDWESINKAFALIRANKSEFKNITLQQALDAVEWTVTSHADQIALWALVDFEWGFSYDSIKIPDKINTNNNQYYMKDAASLLKHLISYDIPIHLSEPVKTIQETSDTRHVKVTTTKDTYISKRVILTTSINVIKYGQISIIPELSPKRKEILDKYSFMAYYEVIIVIFKKEFWASTFKNHQCILYGDTKEKFTTMIINTKYYASINALEFHFTGDFTKKLQNSDYSNFIIKKILKKVFNNTCEKNIKSIIVTNWGQDVITLGSFTTKPFGIQQCELAELRKPHLNNKLIFAGESFNKNHTGYIQSAYKSSLMTVKNIII